MINEICKPFVNSGGGYNLQILYKGEEANLLFKFPFFLSKISCKGGFNLGEFHGK